MEVWSGKVAFVTGASSGIGAAISRALVHHGMVVVGVARRLDRLEQLAKELDEAKEPGRLYPIRADLRKEEDILEAFSWTIKELGAVDVLVNNAGVFHPDNLSEGSTEKWRVMLEVNVLAVCICSREFLNAMERRGCQTGHIININSLVGHASGHATLNVYSGTKHAITAIASGLRTELAEKNSCIKVTNICPGLVATEIFQGTKYLELLKEQPMLDSDDVADTVIGVLSLSSHTQVCDMVINSVPTKIDLY